MAIFMAEFLPLMNAEKAKITAEANIAQADLKHLEDLNRPKQ